MLIITPATAEAITAQTADAYAAQAATRPLAGFGAGAFTCEGVAGAAYKTSIVDVVQVDSVQRDAHNFIQMARQYPVTPGGVGPHPAREPVPV